MTKKSNGPARTLSRSNSNIIIFTGHLSRTPKKPAGRRVLAAKAQTEEFTCSPGKYVGLAETIRGFKSMLSGELDGLPEQAFYLRQLQSRNFTFGHSASTKPAEMETTSQELLKLENKSLSSSLMESTLFICKEKDSDSKRKQPLPNGRPLTSSVPSSQVLGKVKDFLGVMSEANKKLQVEVKDNPKRYDIEVLNGSESEIIEMDLMLGIADLHTPEAVAAAESAVASHHPLNPLAASIGEMDSEDTTDDDDDHSDDGSEDGDEDCGTSQAGLPMKHGRSESGEEDSCGSIGRKRSKKQLKKRPEIVELS